MLIAAAGIAISLLISGVVWIYFDQPVFLLVVPFVPFLFWRNRSAPPGRQCPTCGFSTRDPEFLHCPRDGTELVGEGVGVDDDRES